MSKSIHQESGEDKITFRLPTDLKQQFKEQTDNMSAELEEFVRQKVNEPETDDGLEPFPDLDEHHLTMAYQSLIDNMSSVGTVPGRVAKRAVAERVPHTDQSGAYRHLKRLSDRGYVKLQNHGDGRGLACVYVRPFSRRQR